MEVASFAEPEAVRKVLAISVVPFYYAYDYDEKRISDVKEEGAVKRGRENRLARATKSSFDHAVKSFNMVDAFGLLSCSAVHDFVPLTL